MTTQPTARPTATARRAAERARDAAFDRLRSQGAMTREAVAAALDAEVEVHRLDLPPGAEIHTHSSGSQIVAWGTVDGWPFGPLVTLADRLDDTPDLLIVAICTRTEHVIVVALEQAVAAAAEAGAL